jgi:hypothetical protein
VGGWQRSRPNAIREADVGSELRECRKAQSSWGAGAVEPS